MTDQDWADAGYKRHDQAGHMRHADYVFQKRFDDERGKKYFITVFCYDRSKYPPPHNVGTAYMATAKFHLGNPLPFFNVEMNGIEGGGITVEEIEGWFERIWELFGKPYYYNECGTR